MKQLLIGPRKFLNSTLTGGEVVLFENWIEYCDSQNEPYSIIDANKANYKNVLVALFSIYLQILKQVPKCDVAFLQGSKNDYFFITPLLALVCKIFNKPFFLRKFAGKFPEDYNNAPRWKRIGVRYALKHASGLFWEVKRMMQFGQFFNNKCYWLPNTRKKFNHIINLPRSYDKKKFVFLSQVKREKGVDEMIKAFDQLGSDYHLDIYGPLIGYTKEELGDLYKGEVSPEEVPEVLSNYSVLLLASKRKDEGYPGIIIEAFGMGLPVVASAIGGIPEMITDGENGVLCEPNSSNEIVKAIKRLEQMDFSKLSHNAAKSFDIYDGETVNKRVLELLKQECHSI